MKMPLIYALLPLWAALVACQPSASEVEADLMERHDKAMQQTGQLYELRNKIGTATPATAPYLHGLLAADNAMMRWMHRYHPDTTAAEVQRLAYFLEQQSQLAAVEKQLQTTIDSASLFVKQNPSQ